MTEYVADRENVWPYGSHREEIVRCRDCKYGQRVTWSPGSGIPGDFIDCTGELVQTWDYLNDEPEVNPVKPDGYCAWGERREDA